jgi:hypothetical protein
LGINLRIVAAARCGFQRGDGVLDAPLHKQCVTENMQRAGMLRMIAKHIARDLLGFTRPLAVQSQSGALDERVGVCCARNAGTAAACACAGWLGISASVCHRQPSGVVRARRTIACRAVTITEAG